MVTQNTYSILIAITWITSFALLNWFDSQCNQQVSISKTVGLVSSPLYVLKIGLRVQFIMVVICSAGFLSRPKRPVLSFGVSVWITILAIVMSVSAVAAAKNFPRLLESLRSFTQATVRVDQGQVYQLVDDLQTKHKCCGLRSYEDYTSTELRSFLLKLNKIEPNVDVPKSCCTREVEGCNQNVFNGASSLVNRDFGCYEVISKTVTKCNANLVSWTIILLYLQAIYMNILTWAHLRHHQNLSFWIFGRVRRQTFDGGIRVPLMLEETSCTGAGDYFPTFLHQD